MSRLTLASIIYLAMLSVGLAAPEPERVYQWTDADGVVHYSQTAPETTPSTARDIRTANPDVPPAVAEQPKTADERSCDQARRNRDLLGSDKSLQADKDGDGKPEPMSDEDRQAAKTINEQQIAMYCKG